jgi:hypothetical protein
VVRLVVEDDDLTLAAAECPQDARRHHVRRLPEGVGLLGFAPAEKLSGIGGDTLDLFRVSGEEGVVVDDLDLGLEQRIPQVGRDKVPLAVVVLLPLGM